GLSSTALRTAEFRKILLIKFSALGDVVHSIPVLNKLRRRYPSAEIDWLVRPAFAELIAHHPAVSHAIPFPRRRWAGPLREQGPRLAALARLLLQLRSRRYDLVIDLQGQLRSAILALATGADVRIGFDRPRPEIRRTSPRELPAEAWKHCWQGAREGAWLAYSHHIALPTIDLHAVDRYLCLGPMLGLDLDPPDFSFVIPAAALARVEPLLSGGGARHVEPRRPDQRARAGGSAAVLCRLRDQRFGSHAPCRRARPAGGEPVRTFRPAVDRPLPPTGRGHPRQPALLAVLFARAL